MDSQIGQAALLSRRHAVAQWLVFALVLLVTAGLLVGFSLHALWGVERREQERLSTRAGALEAAFSARLAAMSKALRGVRDITASTPDNVEAWKTASRRLAVLQEALQGVETLSLADGEGRILASSLERLVGQEFSPLSQLGEIRQHADAGYLYVSAPFREVSGNQSLSLAVASPGVSGGVARIVAARVEEGCLATLTSAIPVAPDSVVLAVHSADLQAPMALFASDGGAAVSEGLSDFLEEHRKGGAPQSVLHRARSTSGGKQFAVVRTVNPAGVRLSRPLYIAVLRDTGSAYAGWLQESSTYAGAFVVWALVAALGLLVYRRQQARTVSHVSEAAAVLRASEDRYRSFLRTTSEGCWRADRHGRLLEVNAAFCRMCGFSEEELLATNVFGMEESEAGVDTARRLQEVTTHGETHFTCQYRRKDGRVFDADVRVQFSVLEDGYLVGLVQDITQRTHLEQIRAFLAQTTGAAEGASFLQALARYLSESLGMECVGVGRLEDGGKTGRMLALWRDGRFEEGVVHNLEGSPCGGAPGCAVWCAPSDARKVFPGDRMVHDLNAESYAGVTLSDHDGRPIGLIAALGRQPMPNRSLTEATLRLVAIRAAGELERLDAAESLRRSEERFRRFFEDHSAVMLVIDPDTGSILDANKAAGDFYGWPVEHLQRMNIQEINSLSPDEIRAEMQRARSSQRFHFEFRHRRADGSIRDVDVYSTPISTDGRERLYSIIHDVTDRKQAELALRRSEAGRREQEVLARVGEERGILLDNIQTQVWYLTDDHTYGAVNAAHAGFVGMKQEDLAFRSMFEIYPEAEAKGRQFRNREAFSTGKPVRSEEWTPNAAGEPRLLSVMRSPVRREDTTVAYVVCSAEDITEREQAVAEARETADNFHAFFRAMDDMIMVAKPTGEFLFSNGAVSRKLGYTPRELAQMNLLELHPPDKIQEAKQIFAAMLRGERISCPLPLVRKNGDLVPVETRVWFGRWNGEDCVYGISKDLTAEQEAQQRFERLFNSNPAAMALTMLPERRLYDVNQAFLDLLGYSREEVVGATSQELGLFPDPAEQARVAQQLAAENRVYDVELKVRRKDGAILQGLFSGEIINSQGKEYYLTVMIDITDRKRAAEELLKQTALQEMLTQLSSTYISLPIDQVDAATDASLGELGRFVRADRVYLFDYDHEKQTCSNTHEWCEDGVEPQIDELQDVPLSMIPEWVGTHRQGKTMFVADVQALDPEDGLRQILEPQAIRSLITVPMMEGDDCIGFAGFDYVREKHPYSEPEQRLLTVFAQMLVNVHKRRETEEALKESEAYNRAMLAAIPDLIFVLDQTGRFLDCRVSSQDALVASPRDFINQPCEAVLPRKVAQQLQHALAGLFLDNDTKRFEYHIRLGEEERAFEASVSRLGEGKALAITRDITERKQAEANLIEANRHLEEASARANDLAAKAEVANRAKTDFLANMSHEIRTPMNAILGFAQVLERDPDLTERQAEQVRTINRSGSHLLRLINDILDMSKIESGRVALNPTAFNLHDFLEEMELVFRPRMQAKRLGFTVDWPPEIQRYVVADEGKLRQVLVNLIANAAKFTEKGQVCLRVRTEPLPSAGGGRPTRFRFAAEVEDTGPGIARDDLERMFNPFQQTETGLKAGGTGLGLTISRRFVEAMGGDLTVTSRVGKGSCFRCVVPMEEADEAVATRKSSVQTVVGLDPGTQPCRVLIVDDHRDNRVFLADLLESVGFEVREAANGVEALNVAEEWSPHAVLMDMRMPVMDGYEATSRLKDTEFGRRMSVIAVTASAFEGDEERARKAGVDGYLRKPFRSEDLFDLLAEQLGLRYVRADHGARAPEVRKVQAIAPDSLAILPKDLVEAMLHAVADGDQPHLVELIDEAQRAVGADLSGLRALADRYDYEALERLLESL